MPSVRASLVQVTRKDSRGRPVAARCVRCNTFNQKWNVTRMYSHWLRHAELTVQEVPKAKRVKREEALEAHFPPLLSASQMELAAVRLVFAAIQNGWSQNCLKRPSLENCLKSLRPDFVVPSKHVLCMHRDRLLAQVLMTRLLTIMPSASFFTHSDHGRSWQKVEFHQVGYPCIRWVDQSTSHPNTCCCSHYSERRNLSSEV